MIRTLLPSKALSFLCVLIVCISVWGSSPREAVAQGLPVQDILGTIQNTFTALSTAALEEKELIWDGLFSDIATQALQQMTTDMIEWVNSGFDGEPVFITDFAQYFLDAADKVAGEYIYGDELSTICTPFQLDVTRAVANQYQERYHGTPQEKLDCGIDDIPGGNTEVFLSGTLSAGGWSMFFETVLNPQNTRIGAEIMAWNDLKGEVDDAQENKKIEAIAGGGIESQTVCTPSATGGGEDCTIVTPGSIIKDQITARLNIPIDRLIQADEINEVIGALFGNLANQAVMGVNGLLGLGGNSSFTASGFGSTGGSYLDAVREEKTTSSTGSGGGNKIEEALRTETQVLEMQLAIVTALDEVSSVFADAQEEFEGDSCFDLTFPDSFSDKLEELLEEVPATIEAVVQIEGLLETYEDGNTNAQMQALRRLSEMQQNGLISGRTAVIQYDYYLKSELSPLIADFEEDLTDTIDACS